MRTSRPYYDDCYTSLFRAEVRELSLDGSRVYLDGTYFYPTSGGQPHDLGALNGVPLVDVVDEGERIAHVLSSPGALGLSAGQELEGQLDWERRFEHMQQHTGQHLLSAVFVELYGLKTLSFHMGSAESTIEIDTGQLSDVQIDAVERRANDLVMAARPVSISYEDASDAQGLRKPSDRSGPLRIITIESYDRSACGGTHVRSTAEIGPVQIRNLDKVRGNVRLEFVCGGRALRVGKEDFRLLTRLARAASLPASGLEEYVASLRLRLEAAEKSVAKLQGELAAAEARRLYDVTVLSADGLRRVTMVSEVNEMGRLLALAFTALSKTGIVLRPKSVPGALLLAYAADSGYHAGNTWRSCVATGGRGGGSATLAQGQVTDPEALGRLIAQFELGARD